MKKYWFLLLAVTPLLATVPQTSGGIRYIMDYGSIGNLYKCGGCSGGCSPVVDDNTSSPIRVKVNAGTPLSYCSFNNSGSIEPFKPKMIIYASKYLENSPQMGGIILKHFSDFTTLLNGGVGNQPLIAGFGSLSLEQKDTVLRAISKYDRNSFMLALNFNSVKFWENNRTKIQKFMAELISGIDGKDKDMYEKKWKELSMVIEAGVQLYNGSLSASGGRLLSQDYISRNVAKRHIEDACNVNQCWTGCAKDIVDFNRQKEIYRKGLWIKVRWFDPMAQENCVHSCGFASSGDIIGRACTSHAHIFSEGRSGTDLKTAIEFGRAVGKCVKSICTGGSGGLSGKIGRAKEIGAIFSAISSSETDKGRKSLHSLYNNPAVKELSTIFSDVYLREIKDYAHDDFIGELSATPSSGFSSVVKFVSNTKLSNGFSSLSKLYATGVNVSEAPPPAKADINRPEIPEGRTPDPEPPPPPYTGGSGGGGAGVGSDGSLGSTSVGGTNNRPIDQNNPSSYQCGPTEALSVIAVSHIGGEPKNKNKLQKIYDNKFGSGVVGTETGYYLSCGRSTEDGFNVTKKLGFQPIDHKSFVFSKEFKKCYQWTYEGGKDGDTKDSVSQYCPPLFEEVFAPFASMVQSNVFYTAVFNFKTGEGFDWSNFNPSKAKNLFATRVLTDGSGAALRRFKTYRMVEVSHKPAKKEDESSHSVCRVEEISRDWVSYPESGAPRGYRLEFKLAPTASICDHSIVVFNVSPVSGGSASSLSAKEAEHESQQITSADSACIKDDLIQTGGYTRISGGRVINMGSLGKTRAGGSLLFAKSGFEITPSMFSNPTKALTMLSGAIPLKYGLTPWFDVSMENPITEYGRSMADRIKSTPGDAQLYDTNMLESNADFSINRTVFMSVGSLVNHTPPQYEHHKFLSYDRGCNPGEKHTVDCKNCSSPGGGSAVYKGVTITR